MLSTNLQEGLPFRHTHTHTLSHTSSGTHSLCSVTGRRASGLPREPGCWREAQCWHHMASAETKLFATNEGHGANPWDLEGPSGLWLLIQCVLVLGLP